MLTWVLFFLHLDYLHASPTAVLLIKHVQNHRNYIFYKNPDGSLPVFYRFRVVKHRIQLAKDQIAMDHDPITKFQGITFLGGSMVRFSPFRDAQPPCPLTNRS